ncbi:hypothetical protein ACE7GA_22295 [Roseomonas sp. CCTCC AB2023176]|uniref:hypothetical protein n=1 Tax=Roseomonas sp. CCTCC AB2023176 TaxID=3342640 RepID=UPI0035D65023
MNDTAREKRGSLQRAIAGDGTALAAIRRRLQDGQARSTAVAGDRAELLRGAYAAALDLLPRLASANQERR